MKQIHYLSVQGRCAPSFWFKNFDGQSFRSFVESITLNSSLLVSSIYRSDLFYFSEVDRSDLIIRTWCALKGFPYHAQTKSKLIRADSTQRTFEIYFDTLAHLMSHPKYYARYKARLHEVQQQEGSHAILNELMKCDLYLTEYYQTRHMRYVQLTEPSQNSGRAHFSYLPLQQLTHLEKIILN